MQDELSVERDFPRTYREFGHRSGCDFRLRLEPKTGEEELTDYPLFLLTTPNEKICKYDDYVHKGYNYYSIKNLVSQYFDILEYTERHGNICIALIKK